MLKTLPYALALITVAGCATDPDANDDYGTIGQLPPTGKEPAEPGAIGIARATPAQRARMIEAALGVDADRAIARAETFRNDPCPRQNPTDTALPALCDISFNGGVTFVTASDGIVIYTFDHFDVKTGGRHETFDGRVSLFRNPRGGHPIMSAELDATLSDGDTVAVHSIGVWNLIDDVVISQKPTTEPASVWVSAAGIGTYDVISTLELATRGGKVSLATSDKADGVAAASPGNGACWKEKAGERELPEACDLDLGFVTLDQR